MAENQVNSIYMTFPDQETAAAVAKTLLDERLIACANLFPAGRSLYRWQTEFHDEPEVVAIAKTSAGRLDSLVARVRELHPYNTPCVVALAVAGGDDRYLDWVRRETE
jgi:periplasmic divalent cation tolerance protein